MDSHNIMSGFDKALQQTIVPVFKNPLIKNKTPTPQTWNEEKA